MGDSQQYSCFLITFSPTGKLVQIEHALIPLDQAKLLLESKRQTMLLLQPRRNCHLFLSTNLLGMSLDFQVLVRKSRKQAEQYHRLYKVVTCEFYDCRNQFLSHNVEDHVMAAHIQDTEADLHDEDQEIDQAADVKEPMIAATINPP